MQATEGDRGLAAASSVFGSLGPHAMEEILQRLGASNEGRGSVQQGLPDKLALLERRLVPASPVASLDNGGSMLLNQNSVHSVTQPSAAHQQRSQRDGTPSISNSQQQQQQRSLDGLEASSEQPLKRRRLQAAGETGRAGSKAAAAGGGARGASPPAGGAQQRMSPFLAGESGGAPRQQPTPSSSKKQKNTISRYFPQLSGGPGGVVGGDTLATAAKRPSTSPGQSEQQVAQPAAIWVQNLQLEAQRLR